MAFTHDTEMALLAAVTLVNTAEEPDTLVSIADLDAFFEEHEYTGLDLTVHAETAYDHGVLGHGAPVGASVAPAIQSLTQKVTPPA